MNSKPAKLGGCIYKLTSRTSGKSYVGYSTKTARQRFAKHVTKAFQQDGEGCRHLNNAIVKYGPDDFIVETLFQSDHYSVELLKAMEVEMIDVHNTLNPNGYNLTRGC